ncbi:MAG: TetR/AcrR family transcriptional regulator, partial [Microthrixaceae bacterium]
MSAAAQVIPFPSLADGLPVRPSPALDPVLDATVTCVARHGLAKTTMSDVAREMGVAPSTVYRKVGSIDNATVLVFAREAHRLIGLIPEVVAGVSGPRIITVFLTATIEA